MLTVIKKELLENILTLRFVIGFLACNVLFGITTFVLVQDSARDRNTIQAARQDIEAEISRWTTYSCVRPTVIKEPTALSTFGSDRGNSRGRRLWISHTRIPVFTEDVSGEGSHDLLGFFQSFDFVNVMQIMVSLTALLFSFDAISGEKQKSSLKLILSNPIGRIRLLISKYLGSLLTLLPILLSSLLVSLLVYFFGSPYALSGEDWIHLLLIAASALLFGAVFVAVGILISSLTSRIASSLVFSMLAWVFLILLYPSLISFLAAGQNDAKEARDFRAGLKELTAEYEGCFYDDYAVHDDQDYLFIAQLKVLSEGRVAIDIVGEKAKRYIAERLPDALERQNEYALRRFELENGYFKSLREREKAARNFMRLSPASLLDNCVNALTATDAKSHETFIEQVRHYRQDVISYIDGKNGYDSSRWFSSDHQGASHRELVEELEKRTRLQQGMLALTIDVDKFLSDAKQEIASDSRRKLDLADMPRFSNQPVTTGDALVNAAFDIFLMFVYIAVVLALTFIRFITYDPR